MCSLSQKEVAAQRLTWRHRLCNGRGGSNDDDDVETTTTTTAVTVSLRSNQRCKANAVNVNDNVDISVLQQLHWDVTATTVGVLLLRWRSDCATRAGGGRCNESCRSKEGVTATMAAVGGKCNKSGR
jgi:hypothetical protein